MTPEEARAKAEVVTSIAEPFSVKIERNSKGYNYELGYHSNTPENGLKTILDAKARLELELYGTVQKHTGGAL